MVIVPQGIQHQWCRSTVLQPMSSFTNGRKFAAQLTLDNLDRYEIMYGLGSNPQAWDWVSGPT